MILRRYMTQQVATNTAIVLLFLMALLLGGRLIRYFGIAAEGRLDVGLLFAIIGYNIPTLLELILPLSFFIALMLVLGRMYVDHEMSVLFASGISRGRMTRLVMPLIFGMFLGQTAISLWAKPWGLSNSEHIWQTQSLGSLLDLIRPKSFINSGNYHLYVDEFDKKKRELKNLYVIQQRTDRSGQPLKNDVIITAKHAYQVPSKDTDQSMQLDLFQGRRYELGTENAKYNQTSFEQYRITLEKPASDQITETNVETQTTAKLLSNWQQAEVKAELGYRFSMPWLIIIAAMLATPLAQVRPRQGRWIRLLPSVLIFASCAIGIISLRTAISKGHISVLSYGWLLIGFGLFSLLLNWQSRVAHRIRYRRQSRQLLRGGQS